MPRGTGDLLRHAVGHAPYVSRRSRLLRHAAGHASRVAPSVTPPASRGRSRLLRRAVGHASFGPACCTTSKDHSVEPLAAGFGRSPPSPPPWCALFIGPSIQAWNDSSSRHRV